MTEIIRNQLLVAAAAELLSFVDAGRPLNITFSVRRPSDMRVSSLVTYRSSSRLFTC